jgi:predicted metal-dependent phosphoesterase TrpH
MKIDLHSHSTHSDGKETVQQIFQYAAEAGLDVLALTDHDTTAGWDEARVEAAKHGITFVPGIEITTKHHDVSVHMLAYLPDPNYAPLIERLDEVRNSRETRIERYVENLQADYPGLTMDGVRATLAEEGKSLGRPHIADALVALGVFPDRTPAFDGPLHKSSRHFVPSEGLETIEAIQLIRAAGGVPVMAHPMARSGKDKSQELVITDKHRERFVEVIEAGLGGFEVDHVEVGSVAKNWLVSLAEEFDLVMTGSSDYHGLLGKPNRLGDHTTSLEMLKRIESQATGSVIQWA